MKPIESSLGRRKFLIATGLASMCVLTCKKIAGFIDRDFQINAAMASEQAATTAVKAAGNRCPYLLSPFRIRNRVLKNRIMHTVSPPYFMQGPENFPTEMYRNHYSNMAKNAAIVSMNTHYRMTNQRTYEKTDVTKDNAFNHYCDCSWDDIPMVYNYINEMIENIHYQGALILFTGNTGPSGYRALDSMPTDDEILADAKEYEQKGYDVYQLQTTSLKAAEKIRAATNLILMGSFRGAMEMSTSSYTDSNQPTAAQLEQAVEQAKKIEGVVDIMWIRVDGHPNAWNQDRGRPKSLAYAEAIKKAGIKIYTCPSGGFHDPVENDGFIASGKTDMVGMTTPLFADPELVRKLKEGRPDDVLPCIACQECHGISMTKPPWYSTCTVNPTWGLPPYQLQGITKPTISKKVAVIGGGPAGMKAALMAAERGHKVILYEKDIALGGLLKISDYSQCRWNYKDLKEYFIHHVTKAGINVKLNTTATPEMIKAGVYDTVLVATGTDVVESKMKTEGSKVFNILESYYKKNELGKNVAIIGAGKFGIEAAISMLKDGHKVTMLTSGRELVAYEDTGPHNWTNQENIYRSHPNFSYVLEATVKDVIGGKVTYTDSTGNQKTIQADSIVIWSGLKPRMDEAEKFIGSAEDVILLGDCTGQGGTIQKTIRSAFFVASQV